MQATNLTASLSISEGDARISDRHSLFPYSFFGSVKSREPSESGVTDWASFIKVLRSEAAKPKPTKESQYLLSPARFNGTRAKANVIEAGLICFDTDHGGTVDGALAALTAAGLAGCVHTTASNRDNDRFRALIPLSTPVSAEAYRRVWHSVNLLLGNIGDTGKAGSESLFYMPATYSCAGSNRFHVTGGLILGAQDWLDLVPTEAEEKAQIAPTPSIRVDLKRPPEWSSLYDCPFVRGEWITDYLGLAKGRHHVGLFKFMVRTAMSARARAYEISASQLEELARELDHEDGCWYVRFPRDIHAEAVKAIGFARVHATPPKPRQPSHPKEFPPCDFMLEVQKLGEAYQSGEVTDVGNQDELDHLPEEDDTSEEVPMSEAGLTTTNLDALPLKNYFDHRYVRPYTHGGFNFISDPAMVFLADRCVVMSDGYYVKEKSGVWTRHPKKATAETALNAIYRGMNGQTAITQEKIKKFFGPSGGVMMFEGSAVFPGLSSMGEFSGGRYLNSYRDTRLRGSLDDVEAAEHILRLVRENLCDLPRATLTEMFDEINGTTPTLFKWVLHWLASSYLRPGKHIGTALWFVGPTIGVGKGTLAHVMKSLIGHEWCAQADETENERGWNTYLKGKLFIEADEFKMSSRRDFKDMLKRVIGNPITTIVQRNKGSFMVPTVANWFFSTNSLCPIEVEKDDRRHTFVKTTSDPERVKLAKAFWLKSDEERERALRGFAAVLSAVDIDDTLIQRPFHTELRADLMAANMPLVERWFALTDRGWSLADMTPADTIWLAGDTKAVEVLWKSFLVWVRHNEPRANVTQNSFGRDMSALAANGYVERSRIPGTGAVRYEKSRWYHEESARYHSGADDLLRTGAGNIGLMDLLADERGV